MAENHSSGPKVYIIILTWNNVDASISCLISLNSLRYENVDVVVVDNHSEDGTVQRLREIFPNLDIIINQRNLGYTGGNNVGIRCALQKGADYVLILNNDTVVHPNLIDELVAVAESDPTIAVVGAKNIKFNNPRVIWGAWADITYGPNLTRVHGLNRLDSPKYRQIRDVDQVIGCGYMWRRQALLDIGLLDTNFFCYHDDVDWCYRAAKAGWRVVYVGTAVVYHRGHLSLSTRSRSGHCVPLMYFLGRNAILFARKHGNFFKLLRLLTNFVIGSFRRFRVNRKRGWPTWERQFWLGVWDGFRNRNRQEHFRV